MKTNTTLSLKGQTKIVNFLTTSQNNKLNTITLQADGSLLPAGVGELTIRRNATPSIEASRRLLISKVASDVYPLIWYFPNGVGTANQNIYIRLHNSSRPAIEAISVVIEGGGPAGSLTLNGLTLTFGGGDN